MNPGAGLGDQSPEVSDMDSILHWMGVAGAFGFVAFCLLGFIKGLSLKPNASEHRSQDKADLWRYWR